MIPRIIGPHPEANVTQVCTDGGQILRTFAHNTTHHPLTIHHQHHARHVRRHLDPQRHNMTHHGHHVDYHPIWCHVWSGWAGTPAAPKYCPECPSRHLFSYHPHWIFIFLFIVIFVFSSSPYSRIVRWALPHIWPPSSGVTECYTQLMQQQLVGWDHLKRNRFHISRPGFHFMWDLIVCESLHVMINIVNNKSSLITKSTSFPTCKV